MTTAVEFSPLRVHFDTRNCVLRRGETCVMEEGLRPLAFTLRSHASGVPLPARLDARISYGEKSHEFHVGLRLSQTGCLFLTGDHDSIPLLAFERSVQKIVWKVRLAAGREKSFHAGRGTIAKSKPESVPTGTASNGSSALHPSRKPGGLNPALVETDRGIRGRLQSAYGRQDYVSFRQEISNFDATIRHRIDAWFGRFPQLAVVNPESVPLAELVEEVKLTAFAVYEYRPEAMRPGDWVNSLVGLAMRNFLRNPDIDSEPDGYLKSLEGLRAESRIDGVRDSRPDRDGFSRDRLPIPDASDAPRGMVADGVRVTERPRPRKPR